jgi:hypothetical protein
MDLESRLVTLWNSLGEFKPEDNASWQLGQIFNALVEEAKKEHGNDPVLSVIEPVQPLSMGSGSTANCGTLRASVDQILQVVRS